MAEIIDLSEARRLRERAARLDELVCELHQALRINRLSVLGLFAVLKFPGANGEPYFEYVQDGITSEDIAKMLSKIHK